MAMMSMIINDCAGFSVKVIRTQHELEPVAATPHQLVTPAVTATVAAPAATAAAAGSKRIPSASGKTAGVNSKAGKQTAAAAGSATGELPWSIVYCAGIVNIGLVSLGPVFIQMINWTMAGERLGG